MTAVTETGDVEIGATLEAGFAPLKTKWRQLLVRAGLPLLLLYLLILGPTLVWFLASILSNMPKEPDLSAWSWHKAVPIALSYGGIMIASILITAVFNAALFRFYSGEGLQGQFLAFRFGKDELRQAIIIALVYLVILVLPLLPVVALSAAMTGAVSGHSDTLARVLVASLVLSILLWPVLIIFLGFRLILAPALTFMQKRLRLLASWRLTRGHFWVLFVTFMVIFIGFGMIAFVIQAPANIILYMPPSLASLSVSINQGNIDPAEVSALVHQVVFTRKNLIALLWMLAGSSVVYVFQGAFLAGASLYVCRRLGATDRRAP